MVSKHDNISKSQYFTNIYVNYGEHKGNGISPSTLYADMESLYKRIIEMQGQEIERLNKELNAKKEKGGSNKI